MRERRKFDVNVSTFFLGLRNHYDLAEKRLLISSPHMQGRTVGKDKNLVDDPCHRPDVDHILAVDSYELIGRKLLL